MITQSEYESDTDYINTQLSRLSIYQASNKIRRPILYLPNQAWILRDMQRSWQIELLDRDNSNSKDLENLHIRYMSYLLSGRQPRFQTGKLVP